MSSIFIKFYFFLKKDGLFIYQYAISVRHFKTSNRYFENRFSELMVTLLTLTNIDGYNVVYCDCHMPNRSPGKDFIFFTIIDMETIVYALDDC